MSSYGRPTHMIVGAWCDTTRGDREFVTWRMPIEEVAKLFEWGHSVYDADAARGQKAPERPLVVRESDVQSEDKP